MVGVYLAPGQGEYGARRRHERTTAVLDEWLGTVDAARLALDTRLDPRSWRDPSSPEEVTSVIARLDADRVWIIDPLDGTVNYYFGLPYSNDMWPFHPERPGDYPPLPLIEGEETIATNPDQSKSYGTGYQSPSTSRTLMLWLAVVPQSTLPIMKWGSQRPPPSRSKP